MNSVTYSYYDDAVGAAVWDVNVTVKNTQSTATYLVAIRDCGPFTGYSDYWGEYLCPQGPAYWEFMGWRAPPNQTAVISVPIYVRSASGSGTVNLTVTGSTSDGVLSPLTPTDTRAITITVNNWTPTATVPPPPLSSYAPNVTPKGASSQVLRGVSMAKVFTIQNSGSLQATYAIAASCGAMSACVADKTSTALSPGATDNVTVSFTTPSTAGASNVISVRATYTNANNQSIADTGTTTVATPSVLPSVTPKEVVPRVVSPGASAVTFYVTNNGSLAAGYSMTPVCYGWPTGCVVSSTTVSSDHPNSYEVVVNFQASNNVGSATSPPGAIRLIAQLGVAADTGSIPVARAYAKPAITPHATTVSDAGGTTRVATFTVANVGNVTTNYTLSMVCANVANCVFSQSSAYLNPGATAGFTTTYVAPPVGQSGTIKFIARTGAGALLEADTAQITTTGADLIAPAISLAGVPGEGGLTGVGVQTLAVALCDVDGVLLTPTIVANGVTLTPAFTSGSSASCHATKDATVSFVAAAGANTVTVSVSDGPHLSTLVRHFTYNEAGEAQPIVTAARSSHLVRGGQASSDTFAIRNAGPLTVSYSLAAGCNGVPVADCTPSTPSISVGPGQTVKMAVNFIAPASGSSTAVWPVVTYAASNGTSAIVNYVYTTIVLDQFAPTATISGPAAGATIATFPSVSVAWCDADGSLSAHTVLLDGTPLQDTFASETRAGCTTAGTSAWASLPLTLGPHTLTATATDIAGHVTTSTLGFSLALPAIADFQPQVTPKTAAAFLIPQAQTLAFAVKNVGTRSAQYQIAPDCSQIAAQLSGVCQVDRPTLTLAPGAVDTVRLSFALTTLPPAQKAVGLAATYTDIVSRTASHTGVVTGTIPTLAQLYQPSLPQAGGVIPVYPGAYVLRLQVKNLGVARVTYQMPVSITPDFTLMYVRDTITVDPGQTANYDLQVGTAASVPLGTTGTINLSAVYTSPGGQSVSASLVLAIERRNVVASGNAAAVAVTPKNEPVLVSPSETRFRAFTITNIGDKMSQFDVLIHCRGAAGQGTPTSVACTDSSARTDSIAPGQSRQVMARFTGTAVSAPGLVTLTAWVVGNPSVRDSGSFRTTLVPAGRIAVTTRTVNSENVIERGACLTVSVSQGAAYECGDLRIVHAMPAVRTMNKTRAPTLIYNSRHALGRSFVAADVLVRSGTFVSDLRLNLKVKDLNGVVRVDTSKTITWNPAWTDDELHRLVMGFDASSTSLLGTGVTAGAFHYTFEVRSLFDNDVATDTGTVIVVDRSASEFGRGWWLDGLEQLFLAGTDSIRLWVGGDGSARAYKKRTSGLWVADPTVDRPDTLKFDASRNAYQRLMPDSAYVEFDAFGRHALTRNAKGERTYFRWDDGPSRLRTIDMAAPAQGMRYYTLNYDAGTKQLASIVAPIGTNQRQVFVRPYLTAGGLRGVDRITDSDGNYVGFGVASNGLVTSRTSRVSTTTVFDYDASGTLTKSTLQMAGTGDDIVHTFCAAETASLSLCASGVNLSSAVRTLYDGPRPAATADTTGFYLDRFGAPTKIVNALGYTTQIEHMNVAWPMLATAVVQPNLHRVEAEYDSLARLTKTTDINPVGTGNSVTRHFWTTRGLLSLRDSVIAPTGEITQFSYSANGDREWQQEGRSPATRVNFTYNARRQLETVSTPGNQPLNVGRYEYDAYGNLFRTTTPTGIVNEAFKNSLGMDTLVKTPTDVAQSEAKKLLHRIIYDVSERDSVSIEWNGADSLIVKKLYDADDQLKEVAQRGVPDAAGIGPSIRRFDYDRAGRKVSERMVHGATAQDEEVLRWTFDAAGNLTMGGRDAHNATLGYDRLNRMVSRTGTATASYTYDNTGMRTANNGDARIARTYYPNGQLETDSSWIATADGSSFAAHRYGLRYTYDLGGRRLTLTHPSQLASGTSGRTTFHYESVFGSLDQITDKFNQRFTCHYDDAGRLDAQVWRADYLPVTESRLYDSDSRLLRRSLSWSQTGVLHYDTVAYDPRDKVLNVWRAPEGAARDTFTYDIRGRVTKSVLGSTSETLELDGLGNAIVSNTKRGRPGVATSRYEPGSGRLQVRTAVSTIIDDTTTYDIDLRGNTYHTKQAVVAGPYTSPSSVSYDFLTFRTHTYDTFNDRGKLESHTLTYDTTFHSNGSYNPSSYALASTAYQSQEEYRYDALGRRVWTRSIKGASCNSTSGSPDKWTGCHNTVTRTIWDGDQILYEVRSDGSPNSSTLEDDGATGPHVGTVGYVHGYGIDEPIALDKNGYKVLPFADWRGHFDLGVCDAAKCASTVVKFPQRNVFGAANWAGNLPAPNWFGSLIEGQVDASGYVYRRNRYFDPETGRFTQEDPIGLGGGLNLYGFGGGDAVNFGDPFGLAPCCSAADSRAIVMKVASMVGPLEKPLKVAATLESNLVLMGAPAMMRGVGSLIRFPATRVTAIATPYGAAAQEASAAAGAATRDVANGAQIARGGMFGESAAGEAQFWALESPLNPGYARRVGAATLNGGAPDFVIGGTLRPGAQFITRAAPAFGKNPGGALETVTNPGGVRLDYFHMPW